MNLSDILKDASAKWDREVPANPESIRNLVAESKIELPEEYLTLLLYSNGGEGELAIEPGWFQLWPAEKVMEMNRLYEVERNIPGFFGFGSNGGGEMLAFDTRTGKPWKVVMLPFVPMVAEHSAGIAEDFGVFVQAMGHEFKDS